MRNSAWYHKLWRDKLDELPLKKDDDAAAWANMSNLLDEQLPVSGTPIGSGISKLSTPIKLLVALVIASTIIFSVTWYTAKHNTNQLKYKKHSTNPVTINDKSAQSLSNQSQNQHSQNLNGTDSAGNNLTELARDSSQNPLKNNSTNTVITNEESSVANSNSQTLNTTTGRKVSGKQNRVITQSKYAAMLAALSTSRSKNLFNSNGINTGHNSSKSSASYNSEKNNNALTRSETASYTARFAAKNKQSISKTGHYTTSKDNTYATSANGHNSKAIAKNNTAIASDKTIKSTNDKELADTKIDPVKGSTNNADTKEAKSIGSRSRAFNTSPKTVKTKETKSKSNTKKSKADDTPPKFNYGLEAGINAGNGNSMYAGIFGAYQVKPRWVINLGLRLNTYRTVSGEYSHPSYYSPDSIPAFKITDSRKVMALTIPLTLEYKLTKNISLKAGPVISMQIKQSNISSKLGAVPNIRDTVYHTQAIDSTLKKTTINKLNVGFTGGISIQVKHFSIDAMYQMLTPYKVNSGLGSYQKTNQNFQIGIGYRFK